MRIDLTVNGERRSAEIAPLASLADVLRDQLDLRGTKIGCGNGECGACTVMVGEEAVCSCIFPARRVGERRVTTIEGLGEPGRLTELQRAFVAKGAMQCGFCTAGMVMSAHAFLRTNPAPTEEEVVEALAGNICRCTGYRQIVAAVMAAGRAS